MLVATAAAAWTGTAYGRPAALDCRTVALTAPLAGTRLSGAVEVRGQALISGFQFYKVEYGPSGRDQWTLIGTDVVRRPVAEDSLVVWQTTLVPDGSYRLRLRVVDSTGNYCEVVAGPLEVDNAAPVETDTPAPVETVPLAVVPVLTTPTIVISIPTEVAPRQNVPAMPTRAPMLGLNVDLFPAFFIFGALVMLSVTFFVGAIVVVRMWR